MRHLGTFGVAIVALGNLLRTPEFVHPSGTQTPPLLDTPIERRFLAMDRRLTATALAFAVASAALVTAAQLAPESRPDDDGIPGAAETQRCVSKFGGLDRDSDGALTTHELEKLEAAVARVDVNNDAKVTAAEFQSGCTTGILREKDIKS
jgi:hypothetical protein